MNVYIVQECELKKQRVIGVFENLVDALIQASVEEIADNIKCNVFPMRLIEPSESNNASSLKLCTRFDLETLPVEKRLEIKDRAKNQDNSGAKK